jgi:uncharacterized membrane protein YqjE
VAAVNEHRPGAAGGGLFVSLRRLIGTALELGQVRLELLGTELEAQKIRILDGLIWAALGVMCLVVGVVLLAGCIVYLFGEGYRLQALALLTLAFLAGGGFAIRHARARLKTPPGAFAASVAELAQDRAALRGNAEASPP